MKKLNDKITNFVYTPSAKAREYFKWAKLTVTNLDPFSIVEN